ncbi:hypothetical protein V1505DRAFT_376790 [Lipomyces doorenjongii]
MRIESKDATGYLPLHPESRLAYCPFFKRPYEEALGWCRSEVNHTMSEEVLFMRPQNQHNPSYENR